MNQFSQLFFQVVFILGFDHQYPTFAIGIGVDKGGVVLQVFVDFDDFSGNRGNQFPNPFPGLNFATSLSLFHIVFFFGQINKYNVARLFLKHVVHADGDLGAVHPGPAVLLVIVEFIRHVITFDFSHFLNPPSKLRCANVRKTWPSPLWHEWEDLLLQQG